MPASEIEVPSAPSSSQACAQTGLLDHGGDDEALGPIVLMHGLMGRGRTWRRQVPWLRRHGRVFTYDAAFHTGVGASPEPSFLDDDGDAVSTERFVADLAEILTWIDLGPAVLIGHSMGGLHAWCTAAAYPELVSALVVEDMAPDFRGRTTESWTPWMESWPQRFDSQAQMVDVFGPVAGRYFHEAFDDGRLHGDLGTFAAIAGEWGRRDFWRQWDQVSVPTLLVEAEHTVTPAGQMREMARRNSDARHLFAEGAGHLVHDDAPALFRGGVEAFLSGLDRSGRRRDPES